MATRFELVLHGENPIALRAAGEEAMAEIDRLEEQLSLYKPTSEIAHLNARAAKERVRVTPALFKLLELAQQLHAETSGAFDITIAPLVRCWGFMGGTGHLPSPEAIAEARSYVGMHQVEMNAADLTVRFAREGVMLDLGAIGKGYAIERAVELLQEAGVTSALLHGGTSTVYGLGHPPDADAWTIAIEKPESTPSASPVSSDSDTAHLNIVSPEAGSQANFLTRIPLKDKAMSVSAVWGRAFQDQGKMLGHVLDPRTAHPVMNALLAAVVTSSPTESDALSTALLVLGEEGQKFFARTRPAIETILVPSSKL